MANYYAKVIIDGGVAIFRQLAEKEFVRLYNNFCDKSNPRIEGINEEYERTYSNIENDDARYNKYISDKMEKICAEVNKNSDLMELHSWYENGEYCGTKGYGKKLLKGMTARLYIYEG